MKIRRSMQPLVESPASATSDIAFILIVFFLVCASEQPDKGRGQEFPSNEKTSETQKRTTEVGITTSAVTLNGAVVRVEQLGGRLETVLKGKTEARDRVVMVKTRSDVPFHQWLKVTGVIKDAGGIVTLQIEETTTKVVN